MVSIGTPHALYNAYRSLKIQPFGGHMLLGIDIHEYRNNELGGDFSTAEGTKVYFKLKDLVAKYGEKISSTKYWIYYPLMKTSDRKKSPGTAISDYMEVETGYPLYNVFCGKGSPENISKAIKLAIAFGLVEDNVAAIQKFCDRNIGIDCSGFASNFFGLDAKSACSLGASKMAPIDKRVRRLEEVRPGTAIVFKSGKHVALVDRILQTDRTPETGIYALNCMVAESTADQMVEGGPSDGLNYTEYVLLVTNAKNDPTLFKILRPLKSSKAGVYGVDVYLANWEAYNFWD